MSRSTSAAVLLTVGLALSGCSGEDVTASAAVPTEPAVDTPPAEATSWTSFVSPSGAPLLLGSTLVTATDSGPEPGLAAVKADTGHVLWDIPLPVPAGGAVLASGAGPVQITTGSVDGATVVMAAYEVDRPASGLSEGGVAAYGSAVDVASGAVLWSAPLPGSQLLSADDADRAPTAGTVLVGDSDADTAPLGMLNLRNGQVVWQRGDVGFAVGIGDVVVVRAGTELNNTLVGLDASTGAELWHLPAPERGGLNGDRQVWVLDARAGSVLAYSSVFTINGDLNELLLIDTATGRVRQSAVPGPVGVGRAGRLSDDGSLALVHETNASLQALGSHNWIIDLPDLGQAGVTEQRLEQVSSDTVVVRSNGLVTLDAATGQQVGDVRPLDDYSLDVLAEVDGWRVTAGGVDGTLQGERG